VLVGAALSTLSLAQEFEKPVRIMAGDAFINVEVGHAAPYLYDWNGDGVRDLLAGDFAMIQRLEPELSREQIQTRDALRAERDRAVKQYAALSQQQRADPKRAQAATVELRKRLTEIYNELRPLEPGNDTAGRVWLYRRKSSKVKLPKTY